MLTNGNMKQRHLASSLFLLTIFVPSLSASTIYHATDLGVLPGGNYSEAVWINNGGQVTGYAYVGADYHMTYWSPSTGLKDMGALNGTAGDGNEINDAGQIAGYGSTAAGAYRAVRATYPGGMVDLGTFGGPQSVARGLNGNGDVAGWAMTSTFSNLAAIWVNGGPTLNLGTLPGGAQSYAYDVNGAGHAVGYSESTSGNRAFYWNGTAMVNLGFAGTAFKINDNDNVIGWFDLAGGIQNAFFGTGTGPYQNLGTLGGSSSRAIGISDTGTMVVGDSQTAGGVTTAFLWDSLNGMRNLNTLLDGASSAAWNIRSGLGVNNKGQIVGFGLIGGEIHGVLLDPVTAPEPSTIGAGFILLFIAGAKRLKKQIIRR